MNTSTLPVRARMALARLDTRAAVPLRRGQRPPQRIPPPPRPIVECDPHLTPRPMSRPPLRFLAVAALIALPLGYWLLTSLSS